VFQKIEVIMRFCLGVIPKMYALCYKKMNKCLSKYHFCYKIWNLETFLTMCFVVKTRKGFDINYDRQ